MKKNYLHFLLVFASITSLNSQNLWGVDASIDVTNAQFQNNFIETGTANNYSINDWTALSISQSGGSVSPGAAYWKRNTLGYSQGAYWGGTTPINSPSQANGIAIFDSDYMDNGGTTGAFGNGSSPSPHKGELISPRIDLTGNTDIPLAVKFYSLYRSFQITKLSISFSSDDGVTWGNSVDYRSLQPDLTEGFITVDLPSTSTENVTNLTQCRIKFTFEGDYYFAIVDDITILVSTSLSTNSSNYISNTINLYPNPSSNFIQIKGDLSNQKFKIYNIRGSEVMHGTISSNNQIDIHNLSNGIYLLKFNDGNSAKFIKE
ncbi:T9SS type A sorting domain-containing protein [Flavobacterium sp. NRK F7]|uniref:T9SS type A sorting domain-containing protein n=1 Tax=Flavobacterium sp. NRK F7 TaxID=2954930 RepID=UPI00209069B9|nr:T9SS type A sorting domain-containing protein [Flavobacterium sp. NRK F7]MCO6162529.1 T9SS type A sorting domain-containing protein [Flavobacterium sp. NRK F7]